jgi:hypothetical protein
MHQRADRTDLPRPPEVLAFIHVLVAPHLRRRSVSKSKFTVALSFPVVQLRCIDCTAHNMFGAFAALAAKAVAVHSS